MSTEEVEVIHVQEDEIFNANIGEEQVGVLWYRKPDDDSLGRNVEIEWLSVKPEYRRQGIGTKLMLSLMEYVKDKVWICFWTGRQVERSGVWQLFIKLGFEQKVYLPDYYDDGVGTRLFVMDMRKRRG